MKEMKGRGNEYAFTLKRLFQLFVKLSDREKG